ncbi:MAG: antibiotic biosynthesis monooxygenase [Thiotrichales bacterium]|nr:antibiotic biosynthesis monooxygenase [Thiotrichales bacterium]
MSVDKKTGIPCDSPVTIIVKRRPKPGLEKEFEAVMTGTTHDAMTFPGHLGVNIIRPTAPGDFYRIVFKFDSMRNYIAWESSGIRAQWLEKYAEVTLGDDEQEVLSGLETWFTLPGGEALVPPPRHKMAAIIFISIFPLSLFIHFCMAPFLTGLHIIWQIAIISAVMVLLMTYAIMPVMSKLFHRWLHCQK